MPDIFFYLSGPVSESDGKAEPDKILEETEKIDSGQNKGNQDISTYCLVLVGNIGTFYPLLQKIISSLVF